MNRKYELTKYLFNQYLMFFESEYNFPLMTFSQWISESLKLDSYKKEIIELRGLLKQEVRQ